MKKRMDILIIPLVIYIVCYVIKLYELIALRLDETFIGEAVLHKIIAMLILYFAINYLGVKLSDIGFRLKRVALKCGIGLLLGIIPFLIGYTLEFLILRGRGIDASFSVHMVSYCFGGAMMQNSGIIYIVLCILFSIISAIMEEGMFRGLFLRFYSSEASFTSAMLCCGLLFGVWHNIPILRELIDGSIGTSLFITASLVQIILVCLVGIKMTMLVKLTGSLWVAIVDNFVNSLLIGLLHMSTQSGIDELILVRVFIAQLISFASVAIVYKRIYAID